MKILVELAKRVHDTLAPLFGPGFHPSQAMSGALAVVNAAGDQVLFHATANYNPARGHVERQLMAALFEWTKDVLGTPFILPAGCSVNLYVFNSPCRECAEALALTIRLQRPGENGNVVGWGQNRTVQWYLGFTNYYLAGTNSYGSPAAADLDYGRTLVNAGWRYGVIRPDAPPPVALPAAAAAGAAGAAAGGGGGGAAAAAAAAAAAGDSGSNRT